ncbi:hypothetical protein ACSBR2_028251 [Camellia fascicularis]
MDQKLYNSAKSGDILHFKQLLNENPSLLLRLTPHENTPLHIATQFGHKSIVAEIYNRQQSLLAQPNLDGDTPLHVAARAGRISIVSFLVNEMLSLSYGDIESRGNRGIEILRMRNKWGNTVLHEAVRNHSIRVAEFLMKVDPGLACFENNMARSSAYGGSDGQTALHAAIAEGHFDVIEALVRAKPELIKEANHHGRTPLYYAASMGDHRTVQGLLQLDTDIAYMSDKEGLSPFHVAAYRGHTNIIKEIIRCCPDSGELLDLRGQNILHIAVLGGKLSVVRYILETTELEGLINQADDDGNTPLHLATIERKSWIARYLMWDDRVDRRAKNNIGQKAINNESSTEPFLRFPMTSGIWRQPWSQNTWITRENISPNTIEDGVATVDKMRTYKQMGHTLLMVATLIATVTFAAAFTIPGGFNNNVGPDQGQALLQSSIYLKWFLVSDSIAMSSSVVVACILFWGAVIAEENYFYYFASATMLTHIALSSTGIAFTTGLIAVVPNQTFVHIMCLIIGSRPNLSEDE